MEELSHVLIDAEQFKRQYDTSSCAMVYSSEDSLALYQTKYGDAIDKHKTVFRFGQMKHRRCKKFLLPVLPVS